MNNLNINLKDKVVILDPKFYNGNVDDRKFLCISGFGCSAVTTGSGIYGYFVKDNEQCRIEGYQIERIAP